MARLVLNWLGNIQVTLDHQAVDLGYNKVRALLAYLSIEWHQAHSRDELAGLLWPDSPQQVARKSLRQALTTLRDAIRDEEAQPHYLLISRETLQFNPACDFYADVADFTAVMEQCAVHNHQRIETCAACQERLVRGAALYQGDLLKNLFIADSLPFEEWLLLTRERIRLQMIDMLGKLMAASEHTSNDDAAINYSRRRLVMDPWNEDAYRALMRILARRGQRTAALAELERCKRVLADDLGISPSSETLALYESIKNDTALPGKTNVEDQSINPAGSIPVPLTGLIGREKETLALINLIRREDVRLVTLLGLPGVGKSRLALHIAKIYAAEPSARVIFVPLAAVTNPALVPSAIAQVVGIHDSGQLALFEQLVDALSPPGCILILDTFEQVQGAVSQLANLLQGCPKLKILVTARAPLRLRGEQRFLLEPLALPDPNCVMDLAQSAVNPSIQLFVERVRTVLPVFRLTSKNVQAVAKICVHLDGLPLAIELAAALIRLMPPEQLLTRLLQPSGLALHQLKDSTRDREAHHQTLWQAFHWSFNLLSANAQRMFARLGVFSGGWSLEAAEAVCNVGDIQPGSIDEITELLDNSLIQQEEGSGHYRFRMLNILREFALDRLREYGEVQQAQQRHADYFLTFAKLAEPELTGLAQNIALEQVEQERDNLRKALDWTLTASPEQSLQLAIALFPFWHIRAHLREGRFYLTQALSRTQTLDGTRARALAITGLLAQRQGDYEKAEILIRESIQIYRQVDDPIGLAYALNNLAIVLASIGENSHALAMADESLQICQIHENPLGIARAQMISGQIALNEDRLTAARQLLGASLGYWQKTGDQKNAILCQINLGRVEMPLGNYVGAFTLFEEGLIHSREIKDQQWEMIALWNLAEIHILRGETQLAAALLEDCLGHAHLLGDRYFEAITLNRQGIIAIARGNFIEADRLLCESRDLGERIGSKWVVADALAGLGLAALCSGHYEQAERVLRKSLASFNEQGEWNNQVLTLERLALVAVGSGNFTAAARIFAGTKAWRMKSREPLPPCYQQEQDHAIATGQGAASEFEWQQAWREGSDLPLEQLIKCILVMPDWA